MEYWVVDTDIAARVFKALGDVTRQRLLLVLAHQELSVSELVQVLAQPQSTISRHLKVLREADLVVDRRDATSVMYAAASPSANGHDGNLRGRIQEWMDAQRLPGQLAGRLKKVLNDRQERSESFFSGAAHRWDQLREEHFGGSFHLEALTALLPAEWTVADVGAGTGFLLPVLSRTFRRVIAVEMVAEMILVARSRGDLQEAQNISFRQGSIEALPIQDQAVDLALAVLVLHHVASLPDALAELGRIVKPGGQLLVVEQVAHSLSDFYERMQDRWWGFEATELAGQVAGAGFEEVRHRSLPAGQGRLPSGSQAPDLFVLRARKGPPRTLAFV